MQDCLQVPTHCNPPAFQNDIATDLWKQKQKRQFPLPRRRSFNLNFRLRVMDAHLDCQNQKEKQELVCLPILVHKGGSSSQYAWDGRRLLLLKDLERNGVGGLGRWLADCMRRLRFLIVSTFIARQVRPNYMHYLKWKCVHRIFSSALQVQATQAMLQAIGIGANRCLPSAAALNWVLKDGLGKLSKFVFTASLGPAFDANLKSAIHRSFSVADNLGDISAKAQIQTVCFDNVGLVLAACLNLLCKNYPRIEAVLPFIIYIIFSAMDLFAIYQGLKHVHFLTLNKARLEIIVDEWLHARVVPSAAEVSIAEGIQIFSLSGSRPWPLRIGSVNPKDRKAEVLISIIQSLRNEDSYFLCVESCNYRFLRKPQMGLLLCLHERAQAADIVMGMLQATYMRMTLISRENSQSFSTQSDWDENFLISRTMHSDGYVTLKPDGVQPGGWQNLLEESKRYARAEVIPLLKQMKNAGWVVEHVLLCPTEQVTYSILGEDENLQP